jgi:site-specific DNA-methyltransferase (adenine-specific)
VNKVEIGDAVLYCGDCLDILPTLGKVDCMLTDPFYGIEGGSGGDSRDFGKGAYSGAFEDSPAEVARVAVKAVQWGIENADSVVVTPGNRCLHMYPASRDIGCFWTPAAMTHGPWGMSTFQPILYYGKDWRAGRGALPSGKQLTEAAEKNGHPCPKPINAWKWLLDKAAKPGATVIDPFMGSGTTGVAALQLGRKFIGIELDRTYFDIACKRIELAVAQGQLFEPERPAQVQEALL